MKFLTRNRKQAAIMSASLLALTTVGGIAYAAIPMADGTVKGCYALTNGILLGVPHSKGDVRIVDSAENCRAYEKAITWNQKGQKGDQGIPGAPGAAAVYIAHQETVPTLTLSVPAGSYSVTATGYALNSDTVYTGGNAFCRVYDSGTGVLSQGRLLTVDSHGGVESVTLLDAGTFTSPTTITFYCQPAGGPNNEHFSFDGMSVTALRVNAVNP